MNEQTRSAATRSIRRMAKIIALAAFSLAMTLGPPSLAPPPGSVWAAEDDWPQWRGRSRDGHSRESGLLAAWPPEGPRMRWSTTGLGSGYATMTVAEGKIFTLGAVNDDEFVMAFDETTGKHLWSARNGRRYRNGRGDGPRGAPTYDDGRVYALGGSGDLSVLNAEDGKRIWMVNLLAKFRARNISWGISESPLVLGDRLLVNAGGRDASIVALNKADGSVLWSRESDEAGYSSAVSANIGGVEQAVFFTAERVLGIATADGRLLWDYRTVSNRTANVATPIVQGRFVFVSSDYGTGCALLEITGSGQSFSAREVYFHRDMRNHHSSSVLVGNTLYGFSSSILTALDFRTGKTLWKDRSVGKGSLIYGDGQLYLFSESGVVGLADASPAEYLERGRFRIPRSGEPTWSHPVIANGHLLLRDQDTLYSFDISER